jgi:hypothetical protein
MNGAGRSSAQDRINAILALKSNVPVHSKAADEFIPGLLRVVRAIRQIGPNNALAEGVMA